MTDCTVGVSTVQKRHENSVRSLITLKFQQQKRRKQQITKKFTDAKWHTLIDELNKIVGDLSKDKKRKKHQKSIVKLIQQIHTLWTQVSQKKNSAQKQLSRIEKKLNNLTVSENSMNQIKLNIHERQSSLNQTWMSVTMQRIHQIVKSLLQHTVIRVHLSDLKDKSLMKLLVTVKFLIAETYAVKQLWSSNIKVTVSDQCTKDCVLNQSQVKNLWILQQNYSVKLWEMSLFTSIDNEKSANNTALMQKMCNAFRIIIFTLSINKICWLHTFKQHKSHLQMSKTKETIVVSLFTQALQHKIIQKKIVINSQLYDAHLHDHDTQIRQCFNCEQWGHTQSVCEKTVKCSICTDTHQIMNCLKKRVLCVNCEQTHKTWQKTVCKIFKSFLIICQKKRVTFAAKTVTIHSQFTTTMQLSSQFNEFRVVQSRKQDQSSDTASTTIKWNSDHSWDIFTAAQNLSQIKLFVQTLISSELTNHLSQKEVTTDLMQENVVKSELFSC